MQYFERVGSVEALVWLQFVEERLEMLNSGIEPDDLFEKEIASVEKEKHV